MTTLERVAGMNEITKYIQLSPIQKAFLRTKNMYSAYCGGRGVGKSFIGAYRAIRTMMNAPSNTTGMVIAPTYGVLGDASHKSFMEHIYKFNIPIKMNMQKFTATFPGGQTILFRSAERPGRLRGKNLSWIWMDEAGEINEEVFDITIACLREERRRGEIWATFTPKGRQHWTYETFGRCKTCMMDIPSYNDFAGVKVELSNPAAANKCMCPGEKQADLFTSATRDNLFLHEDFEKSIRRKYTTAFAEQELEGRFIDMNAGVFRRSWFKQVQISPVEGTRIRYWDKAGLEDAGCFTAGVLMNRTPQGQYYIEHVVRAQLTAFKRNELILQTTESDRAKYGKVTTMVEQEPGSGGLESAEFTIRQLAGYHVQSERPSGDKIERSMPFAAQAEAGNVFYVTGPWNEAYLDELSSFPKGKYKDQVDASSGAFNRLALRANKKLFVL